VAPEGNNVQCSGHLDGKGVDVLAACRHILVVEDDDLLSMLLEEMLTELGYCVVGPAARVCEALTLLETQPRIDGALLDLSLKGEMSLAIADTLSARAIPFAFVTGHGSGSPETARYGNAQVLAKPFTMSGLSELLVQLIPRVRKGRLNSANDLLLD
jgi:CheY-like chemotaxis protein